jgi:hypothetical protein
MKRLYYVCAQPATLYYAWQVEVMVNNFLKHGVPPETIHVVTAINKDVPTEWLKLHLLSIKICEYVQYMCHRFDRIYSNNILLNTHISQEKLSSTTTVT